MIGLLLGAAPLLAQQPAPSGMDPAQAVMLGRMTARFAHGGLFLDYDGIPLLKGGVVQVFYNTPQQEDYGSGSAPPEATVESLPDGGRAYTAAFDNHGIVGTFHAVQRAEVHPDGTVQFRLQARWDGPQSAKLEWNPIRLWIYPLIGGDFTAETATATVPGRIGIHAPGRNYPESRLAPPWQRFTLHSPALGELAFTTEDPEGAVAFDAREDTYLHDLKIVWMGDPDLEIPPGKEITRTLTLTITPGSATPPLRFDPNQETAPIMLPVETHSLWDALRPVPPLQDATGHPLLVPQPKQVRFTLETFAPGKLITLYLAIGNRQAVPEQETVHREKSEKEPEGMSRLKTALRTFLADLHRDTGIKGSLQAEGSPQARGIHVRVLQPEEAPLPTATAEPPDSSAFDGLPQEGYRLQVTREGIFLTARDAHGAFYGLQTLRQLLSAASKRSYAFAGAEITDWPSLAFRGAHIFVGRNALPFHTRLIENIFSRYKLNAMVIECEYTRWKSHPELWQPNSMDPDALRAEIALARDYFLEPIPLINTLGHSEWIFKNGQHPDLAEDVRSPHNYDPSNPDTYRLVFDVFGEAVDLFHPRIFHIGHDEVKVPSYDTVGKYPARPENIRKGAVMLFLEDADRLGDWLRERRIRTMLWGDMLLAPIEGTGPAGEAMTAAYAPSVEAARQLRAQIPQGAIVADWRYEPGSEQRNGLRLFEEAGHPAVGSAWFQPENIRGWALQAIAAHAFGTLQTTWAGYDSNETLLESEYRQFNAYVLAAEYAWSGTAAHPQLAPEDQDVSKPGDAHSDTLPYTLPYNAATLFARAYRNAPLQTTPRRGWYVSLRHAANINLFAEGIPGTPWSAYPPRVADDNADTVDTFLNPQSFPEAAEVGLRVVGPHPGGVMLQGRLSPPSLPVGFGQEIPVSYPAAVALKVDAKAKELAFLQATGYAVDTGTRVAHYTVIYTDGQKIEIPLRYGEQIRALDDGDSTGYAATPIAWNNGNALTLRLFRWTNPRPRVAITRIEFRADHPYAGPILFSLTGLPE